MLIAELITAVLLIAALTSFIPRRTRPCVTLVIQSST